MDKEGGQLSSQEKETFSSTPLNQTGNRRFSCSFFRCGIMGGNFFTVLLLVVWLRQEMTFSHIIVSYSLFDNRSLACLSCYNRQGDTVHCISLVNGGPVSSITCGEDQPYCKVHRLHTNDELTSFERGCDDQCLAGCTDTGLYLECVSCCTESLCNTGNFARSKHTAGGWLPWMIEILMLPTLMLAIFSFES